MDNPLTLSSVILDSLSDGVYVCDRILDRGSPLEYAQATDSLCMPVRSARRYAVDWAPGSTLYLPRKAGMMKRSTLVPFALLLLVPLGDCLAAEHNFARWEEKIAAFEQEDATNPPPKGAILFLGSSTIVRWKTLAEDFPEHQIINRGFGGNHICDSTYYAERIIFPHEPKAIFLRAGGNDINSGKTPEQVCAEFQEFVAKVREKCPHTEIFYIGLAPSVKRWKNADKEMALNTMIEAFCKQNPQLTYIDTHSMTLDAQGQPRPELFVADKLHFNADGYKLLVERVRPFLLK